MNTKNLIELPLNEKTKIFISSTKNFEELYQNCLLCFSHNGKTYKLLRDNFFFCIGAEIFHRLQNVNDYVGEDILRDYCAENYKVFRTISEKYEFSECRN